MASAFSENTINPFCDLICALIDFQTVNGRALTYIQSQSKKSYCKNRTPSIKDMMRVKVLIVVVFRQSAHTTSGFL